MSNAGKRTTVKDEFVAPQIKLEEAQKGAAVSVKQQIEAYPQRKAEVTQSDHQAFQDYLNQKAQALPAPQDAPAPEQPSKFNRRNLLKVVAGTAVAGEAAAATYSWVTSGSASDQGARNAGARYADAQRENIERTLIDSKSDVGGAASGNGSRCFRPSSVAALTRSISTPTAFCRRSGIGPTGISTRYPITCARFRAPIRIIPSSSSTARKAARTA
jgi:hypothetical protein